MVVTEVGIVMDVREAQRAKTHSSMKFSEVGRDMETREVQR